MAKNNLSKSAVVTAMSVRYPGLAEIIEAAAQDVADV
jgi:hypothetical protein